MLGGKGTTKERSCPSFFSFNSYELDLTLLPMSGNSVTRGFFVPDSLSFSLQTNSTRLQSTTPMKSKQFLQFESGATFIVLYFNEHFSISALNLQLFPLLIIFINWIFVTVGETEA